MSTFLLNPATELLISDTAFYHSSISVWFLKLLRHFAFVTVSHYPIKILSLAFNFSEHSKHSCFQPKSHDSSISCLWVLRCLFAHGERSPHRPSYLCVLAILGEKFLGGILFGGGWWNCLLERILLCNCQVPGDTPSLEPPASKFKNSCSTFSFEKLFVFSPVILLLESFSFPFRMLIVNFYTA